MNPLNLILIAMVACSVVVEGNQNLPSFALKMLEFQRKLKEEITTPSEETQSVPQQMLNLYRQKEGLGQNTRGRRGESRRFSKKQVAVLRSSNFIRSFKSLESRLEGSTLKVVFDLSTIFEKERIKLAELQFDAIRGQVREVEIWNKVQFLDSVKLSSDESVINVTPVIKRWYKLDEEKQGYYTGEIQTKGVLLTVYSINKNYDLIQTLEDQKQRVRRSLDGNRHRRRGRNGKVKRERGNKSSPSHSVQYEEDIYSENFSPLGNELEDSEITVNQRNPTNQNEDDDIISDQRESLKNKKSRRRQNKKVEFSPRVKPTHCRRVAFQVDFDKIGWGSWVIFPKRYNAYRCEGACSMPLHDNLNPTNHAFVQSMMAASHPHANIPEPCCVPTKLSPISILYHENGEVKQRVHEEMVVEECGCR